MRATRSFHPSRVWRMRFQCRPGRDQNLVLQNSDYLNQGLTPLMFQHINPFERSEELEEAVKNHRSFLLKTKELSTNCSKYSVNPVCLSINLCKDRFFLDIAYRRCYHPGHEWSYGFTPIRICSPVVYASIGDGVCRS